MVVSVSFCFLAVGGLLCHRGSDKLSSLSEDPCQLDVFSSFLLRGSKVLTSSGMNPPLKLLTSVFLFIFRNTFMLLTRFFEFVIAVMLFLECGLIAEFIF